MKGKPGSRWWLSVFFLQMAFTVVSSDAKECTRKENLFTVVGVFDSNDSASIQHFRSTVEGLEKLVSEGPGCPPKVTHRELILHDQMSPLQVINATKNVFLGKKICYIVYSSYGSNGQLVLDHAINSGIPVVSTIPKKEYNAINEPWTHFFDPAKVINLNDRSTRSTKVQVIVDFLYTRKHKEFVAITGTDLEDMSVVSSLYEVIKQRSLVMVDWFIIPSSSDIFNQIREKYLRSHVAILIITNDMRWARKIIVAANPQVQWILATDRDYNRLIRDPDFETFVTIIHPEIEELNQSDYVEDAIGMLRFSLEKWITNSSGHCPSITEIQSHLPEIGFSGKTGFVNFNAERERVHDTYQISTKTPQRCEWSDLKSEGKFYDGVLKFDTAIRNEPIKVSIVEYAPYIMVHPKITPEESCESKNALSCFKRVKNGLGGKDVMHESCCNGFVIDTVKSVRNILCESRLCIDTKLIFNDDGVYGVKLSNGSWNGVVNDIITGKVDMSADLFPNSRRSEVLDFTDVYMPTGIALLVKESKRHQSKIHWTTYMRPFTPTLWYVFGCSVGVMLAFLWIVEKFGPSKTDGKMFHWEVAFRIDNAVCYVLQLTFGRPADDTKPMSNGARLTGLVFGVAMMIIMASYSANLAAFLIISDLTTPVERIYDLKIELPPPGFKYGTVEGSYMADFFDNTDIEYFRNVWPAMRKDNVKSLAEGVNKVRSGELDVLVGDSASLQYATLGDSHCDLKVVGKPFAMSGPSFAVQKGSSRAAILNTALRKAQANGLTTFIQKNWVEKYHCQKEVLPAQLPYKDLIGLFLQLLIAIILCILGTTCHLAWNRLKQEYRKHENKRREEIEEEEDVEENTYEFETFKETNI